MIGVPRRTRVTWKELQALLREREPNGHLDTRPVEPLARERRAEPNRDAAELALCFRVPGRQTQCCFACRSPVLRAVLCWALCTAFWRACAEVDGGDFRLYYPEYSGYAYA